MGGGRWEVGGGWWEVGVGGDSGVDIVRHRSRSFDYLEKVVAWYRHCVSYSRMILSWSDAGHALSGYACVRALRAQYLRVRGGSVDDCLALGALRAKRRARRVVHNQLCEPAQPAIKLEQLMYASHVPSHSI